MTCYRPIPALQNGTQGGAVRLWPPKGTANLNIPCGKCIGCRTDRATHWAARCTHEASLWDNNSFVTLTYDDDHLPENGYLEKRALQLFLKRLRKMAASPSTPLNSTGRNAIRFFACGEYGETTERPHYHAILFNCGFRDSHRVGKDLFESDALRDLWPYGQNRIGAVTPASAAYVAQYNIKKQGQGDHNPQTGEWRPAPFLRMSLRPAIGNEWLKRYQTDLTHGYLVNNAFQKTGIPRYYQNKIKQLDSQLHAEMLAYSHTNLINNPTDRRDEPRLRDAEAIHHQRASKKRTVGA